MFDKDISVINRYVDRETKTSKYKVSHIKGYWSSDDGISINGTHLIKQDGVSVRILMSEKGYQKPKEFKENQEGWTLKNDDYLVKGIVEEFSSIDEVLDNYQEVAKINKVSVKDYGSEDMWHFAVMGV